MPKRIYALAKELQIDSKELVDICTRIGILNKGSALASLEDDEVARISKYLSGTPAAAPEKPAPPPGPIRAPIVERSAPAEIVIPSSSSSSSAAPAPAAPVAKPVAAPVAPPTPEPAIPVRTAPVTVARANPAAPQRIEEPMRPTRDDVIPTGNRVRSLDARRPSSSAPKSDGSSGEKRPQQRREPVINLAKMPRAVSQLCSRRSPMNRPRSVPKFV